MSPTQHVERLATGVAALDEVMHGGFPLRSVTMIAGEPGSGKTVLALQTIFAAARQGKRCLYLTTLSEPSLKLIHYMQLFEFFDEALVEERIAIRDLGTSLRTKDAATALAAFTEMVEREQPAVVVVDSFKAIRDFMPDPHVGRAFGHDLAVRVAAWGATALLVGEYSPQEITALPEFAIADGILVLGHARQELAAVRQLEIRKLRGSGFVSGIHFFDIASDGIRFYPRVRAPEQEHGLAEAPADRVTCGVEGLDELFAGGVPVGSTSVVMGGTGTGKTILGLHFLVEGARRGEPGALFTLEETPAQLRTIARGFGFDLAGYERQGLFHIEYTPPVELSTDRFLDGVRAITSRNRLRRAVLDSLTTLALGTVSERRYKEVAYVLSKHFRAHGVTLLSTLETLDLLGTVQLSGHGVSFAADNIIQLRYVERGGRLDRAISVLKGRGVAVDTELRPLVITAKGMRVGPAKKANARRGLVTRLPSRARRKP